MTTDSTTQQDHVDNENITPEGPPEEQEISQELPHHDSQEIPDALTRLRTELAETQDKFRRLYAEFDNFRKRTQKEKLELFKTAGSETISSLLPVLDDFERAIKSMEQTNAKSEALEGVQLIYQKLKSTLEQKGLKRMESVGTEFDVDKHEAITYFPSGDESQKGKVIDEAECGYFLNDKVIRHAKVVVAG